MAKVGFKPHYGNIRNVNPAFLHLVFHILTKQGTKRATTQARGDRGEAIVSSATTISFKFPSTQVP